MKTEFLTGLGIAEDVAQKILAENGRDIEKLKADNVALETKLTAANETITTANTEIESYKSMDIEGIKTAANEWKVKAEKAEADAVAKIAEMEYDSAVNEFTNTLKFTSDYAKKGFVADFKAKGFKLDNGKFLGADDFVKSIRESSPTTFEAQSSGGFGFGDKKPVDKADGTNTNAIMNSFIRGSTTI